MVTQDFYNLLISDEELNTLLGSTITDSKIYPMQMPLDSTLPVIIYRTVDEGTIDENINEAIIHFDCISDNCTTAMAIQDRVRILLDVQDDIDNEIPYGINRYCYSKSEMSFNFKEQILDIFHCIIGFFVKYLRYGYLVQENSFYILQENEGYIRL